MRNLFSALSSKQKQSLIILSCLIILVTGVALIWVIKSSYQPISSSGVGYSASLIEKLEQNNLDYKYTNDGQILVNQEQLGMSHLLLKQAQGSNFTSHGLELFDKADYGMTEHAQKVTFQRAMQGELERTLSSLSFINYARVHLTLIDKRLFSSDSEPAKASVTLFTEKGSLLTPKDIAGVQSLVAAAVEGLEPEQVTIFSQDGKQVSINDESNKEESLYVGGTSKEQELINKVEKLLSLYINPNNFAVTVNVKLNHEKISSVEKSLLIDSDGEGVVLKKKTSSKEAPNLSGTGNSFTKEINEEIEYSIGSKTQKSTQLAGEIEKISVAVALIKEPNDSEHLSLINLISSAVGLDKSRGDQIAIEYFKPTKTELPSSPDLITESKVVTESFYKDEGKSESTLFSIFSQNTLWSWSGLVAILFVFWLVKLNKKRLPKKAREELLIEVSDWLKKEQSDVR